MLKQEEEKTLECKEYCKSLDRVVNTIIVFANTAEGKILIEIRDKTKEMVELGRSS